MINIRNEDSFTIKSYLVFKFEELKRCLKFEIMNSVNEKKEILKTKRLSNDWDNGIEEVEKERDSLQSILSPIYLGGLYISEYSKILLYLNGLSLSKCVTKNEVLNNFTTPYIDNLLKLFSELENHPEIMQEHEKMLRNNKM